MAEEQLQTVELRDAFYQDSFRKIVFLIASIGVAIVILVAFSIYIYLDKPKPMVFKVDNEWRVFPPVPLTQPYLTTPELIQWVSNVMRKVTVYNFLDYSDQLKSAQDSFTPEGWKSFLNQLNIYANYNNVQDNKLYVSTRPAASPTILKEGLISETAKYGWWVKVPLLVEYNGVNPPANRSMEWQVLVVRVSTLNNLMGVAIENVIATTGS